MFTVERGGHCDARISGEACTLALSLTRPLHETGFALLMLTLSRPRVKLFDRPPGEAGAVLLGHGCVWRAANPELGSLPPGADREGLRAQVLTHMPVVDLFQVESDPGQDDMDYPSTTALYESTAYAQHRSPVQCHA